MATSWGSFTSRISKIWKGQETAAQKPESKVSEQEGLDSALARERGDQPLPPEMLQDEEDLKKIETKIVQEGTMSLEDYRLQLSKSTKVAKYTKMLKHVPGTSQYLEQLKSLEASMGSIQHELAILDSMLPEERRNHQLFFDRGFKRKQRVADSSGRSVEEVNRVLDRFRLTREAFAFIAKLKRDGQKVPDSQEDVMRLLLQNPEFIARFRKLKINPSVLSEASGAQSPSQSMPRRH